MTTYADFKAFYLREIWREGDAALEGDLDRLIKRAEAKMSRDLRQQNLQASFVFPLLGNVTNTVPLPGDFRELVNLYVDGKSLKSVDATRFPEYMDDYWLNGFPCTTYCISGGYIMLNARAPITVGNSLAMTYYRGITPYASNPVTPFYDTNPDFYTAAVNTEVYQYLRDFELSAEYNGKYTKLLEDMQRDSNYAQWPSGQLDMPLPHVPSYRRNTIL